MLGARVAFPGGYVVQQRLLWALDLVANDFPAEPVVSALARARRTNEPNASVARAFGKCEDTICRVYMPKLVVYVSHLFFSSS